MVYLDPLRIQPTAIKCFKSGSCHLFADTLDELHRFARQLGLRPEWFQDKRTGDKPFPHYDLTSQKRHNAIRMGAMELDTRAAAQKIEELRPHWSAQRGVQTKEKLAIAERKKSGYQYNSDHYIGLGLVKGISAGRGSRVESREPRPAAQRPRAAAWFTRMRQAVDRSFDWTHKETDVHP